MPPSVRVAVIVMGILAALLLLSAGLSWYTFDAVVDRIVDQGTDVTEAQARTAVLQNLLVYGLLGVLVALSAVFLPRRQPWARWVGLATAGAIALLTAFSILVTGGVTAYSLLLLVLSVSAVASLLARTTGAWVPKLRAGT
jgi:hypothetical protein